MRAQGQATDRKLNKNLIIQLVDTRCSITYSINKKKNLQENGLAKVHGQKEGVLYSIPLCP